jgi:hypothetical protein
MAQTKLEAEYKAIAEVQSTEQNTLLARANVVGVGVGHKIKEGRETGDACLTVFVAEKLDPAALKAEHLIPATVGKFKTDVIETGLIFAGNLLSGVASNEAGIQTLAKKKRPAEGGYSVGHFKITAGTIATAVIDKTPFPGIPPRYYILSNNHVLANSNDASIGDAILQPGAFDGGTNPADKIATLSKFVPIKFDGSDNLVDAAIAEAAFHDIDREIYWVGYTDGTGTVTVGTTVQKTGRTTNYTTGKVTSINATVNVNYGGGKVAKFVNQITTGNMSAGGDSGSLLCSLTSPPKAVGLLFAGSNAITIFNPIASVQSLLGIRIL